MSFQQFKVIERLINNWRWHDSNPVPLVLDATALPHPRYNQLYLVVTINAKFNEILYSCNDHNPLSFGKAINLYCLKGSQLMGSIECVIFYVIWIRWSIMVGWAVRYLIFSLSIKLFKFQVVWNIFSIGFLYLAVIWIGHYTKYLTERAQRKAFLETRLV